jgi:hypothetical protein
VHDALESFVLVTLTITRGGITLRRDALGNVTLHARGNGAAHVAAADVVDLLAAVTELLRTGPDGSSSATSIRIGTDP